MAKIYLATSWRNLEQPGIVRVLRDHGHKVYDFRNPPHGRGGFAWSDIDPAWKTWSASQYRDALNTQIAEDGFNSDFDGMKWADVCVLLLPCGRSAHLEMGWMAGMGKTTVILTRSGEEPELMAKMCTRICVCVTELLRTLEGV